MNYNNSVITCTPHSTPDPFVVAANGKFYLTFTAAQWNADRVEVWCSDNVLDFHHASRHEIWKPPPGSAYSSGLWAPELHVINGRWYCYVACEDPQIGVASHRVYVLGGPAGHLDPCSQTPWEFLGRLQGLPEDQFAIDGTVISLFGQEYFVYSGWPLGERASPHEQRIFIARMHSATQVDAARAPVCICAPEQPWECSGEWRICEGPQWLATPEGTPGVPPWVGLVYSCAASFTRDYKMNTLRYAAETGADPLDPRAWVKGAVPLCTTPTGPTSLYAPGHGNFVTVSLPVAGYPGDAPAAVPQTLAMFHATENPNDGWDNRIARCQRLAWTPQGPYMGGFVGPLCRSVDEFLYGRPHGQQQHQPQQQQQYQHPQNTSPGNWNGPQNPPDLRRGSLTDRARGLFYDVKNKVEQRLR